MHLRSSTANYKPPLAEPVSISRHRPDSGRPRPPPSRQLAHPNRIFTLRNLNRD